jgi:SEC-C motif-containing protein
MNCPCGSGRDYDSCCGRLHRGEAKAMSPEELMRSRYAAFVQGEIDYVVATHHPDSRDDVDVDGARAWSQGSEWLGLDIVEASGDIVEFIAHYKAHGAELRHHERSTFAQVDGEWFYRDGHTVKPKTVVKDSPKVGRNSPCPCGSGKKYKRCCGA